MEQNVHGLKFTSIAYHYVCTSMPRSQHCFELAELQTSDWWRCNDKQDFLPSETRDVFLKL